MIDILDVNESEANISSTNYTCYLTKDEINELEKIRERNEHLFNKQKNARSSIIKRIVENTYLYLNNNERNFSNDFEKIINKDYYNNIDMDFLRRIASIENERSRKVKKIKTDNKEYELILELVRTQLLRTISNNYGDEELQKVQLRLAKDDEKMLRIIAGNRCLSLNDFLSGYLRYFLSLPPMTRNYILAYPTFLKIERSIKEGKIINIEGMKYKPIKLIKPGFSHMAYTLICFDGVADSFCEILLSRFIASAVVIRDIEFTEEDFVINSYERDVLDLYNNLDVIDVSFVLLNDSSVFINNIIDNRRHLLSFNRVLDIKNENNKYMLKIKYDKLLINRLIKENKKSIDYLCFSDNYNKFIKLIDDKEKAFIKFKKDINSINEKE